MTEAPAPTAVEERYGDRTILGFMVFAHLAAVVAVLYLIFVQCHSWTLILGSLWYVLCGFSITAGYHRCFAHRSYSASAPLRFLYLLYGAASVQDSALRWSRGHRLHHAHTDTERDPYSIQRGFWWAHIGWVLRGRIEEDKPHRVRDLERDPMVRFQHRHYLTLAVLMGAVVPALLGVLWGDPLGALLVAGFLRLTLQWHVTFSVNSFAHSIGRRPYSKQESARDSFLVALFTMGEGYHNFHHRFPVDYRNGIRWFHFDPTKWLIRTLASVGLAARLRSTPRPKWHAVRNSA